MLSLPKHHGLNDPKCPKYWAKATLRCFGTHSLRSVQAVTACSAQWRVKPIMSFRAQSRNRIMIHHMSISPRWSK